jgi:hypothetical protein
VKGEGGKFIGWDYEVSYEPLTDHPKNRPSENSELGKNRPSENDPLYIETINVSKDNNIVTKDANVNKFKMFPISNIFPNELVYTLADQPQYNTYNPQETISIITRNIEDNEEITFVNGVSEDGCIELYDTTFNGTLVEYEGNLIEFIDVFEFNVSNALLVTDDTFRKGATRDEILRLKTGDKAALDKGEFFDELHQELTAVNITGANANVIKTAYADNNVFLSKFVANYAVVKGETAVRDIVTYKPENGTQQLFLVLV